MEGAKTARQPTTTAAHEEDESEEPEIDFGKMVIQKRWTVNGAITPGARSGYFFIDTTESSASLARLLMNPEDVARRSYVMVHGPRGAGKTTRMLQMCEQLREKGYMCAVISLQEGVPFDTPALFWSALGELIHRHLHYKPKGDEKKICDAKTFIGFFYMERFASRKVILIVDEFDLLYKADDLVKDEFLDALRAMRQDSDTHHGLHAFVGVGPFSILKLRNHGSSPFNVSDAFPVPRFRRRDVRELFVQYANESNVRVDQEIPDAIYDLTNGHPGLISFCGKRISEELARGRTEVDYDSWVHYAAEKLVPALRTSWATMSSLVDGILSDEPKHAEARDYLVDNFLLQDPLPLPTDAKGGGGNLPVVSATMEEDINICGFLAGEGILREMGTNQFTLASFLIRNLATWAIRSKFPKPKAIRFDDIPWQKPGSRALDVPRLVSGCVRAFNKERMKAAPTRTSKIPRRKPSSYESVPSEACYHHELFHTLAWWLDGDFNVANEVNAPMARLRRSSNPKRQRCDLFVSSKRGAAGWRCALELCASAKKIEVNEHFDQAVAYGAALKASETWVINFEVCDEDGKSPKLIWPQPGPEYAKLGVINIVHDIGWTKAYVHVNNKGVAETIHLVDNKP